MNRNWMNWTGILCLVLASFFSQNLEAQLPAYSQDFESLDINDVDALGNDGWLVGANVFAPNGDFLYNYFAFPAPNTGAAFSAIATGSGGENQGLQYINVFSDYNNGDHTNGTMNTIDSFVFREGVISSADFDVAYDFTFDFRSADPPFGPAGSMMTAAYVKVLDPFNEFATIFETRLDTTDADFDWSEGNVLSVTIDPAWDMFFLQYGFNTTGGNEDPSGIYYDNLSFGEGAKCLVGDLNGDGFVTLLDVPPFVEAITSGEVSCEADINGDGSVNLSDVGPFVDLLSGV